MLNRAKERMRLVPDEFLSTNADYCIVTDAAADLDEKYLQTHPEVRVIPMSVILGGREYCYGPGGDLSTSQFYEKLAEGLTASTSQINIASYLRFFERLCREGTDILYLCFSSGMSGMYQNAVLAAEELQQEYPDRKIYCVDTLCAAPGEGFLVREAARRKSQGLSLEELAAWAEENKKAVCHLITVDSLMYLHRGGRVSASSAVLGTALQIKPLLQVASQGTLQVIGKNRGMRRAMCDMIDKMEEHWLAEQSNAVAVVHANAQEQADQLQKMVELKFPGASVYQTEIGPVIGCHTGPGLLALVFWGKGRDILCKGDKEETAHG